jgi:hypothetical protein
MTEPTRPPPARSRPERPALPCAAWPPPAGTPGAPERQVVGGPVSVLSVGPPLDVAFPQPRSGVDTDAAPEPTSRRNQQSDDSCAQALPRTSAAPTELWLPPQPVVTGRFYPAIARPGHQLAKGNVRAKLIRGHVVHVAGCPGRVKSGYMSAPQCLSFESAVKGLPLRAKSATDEAAQRKLNLEPSWPEPSGDTSSA